MVILTTFSGLLNLFTTGFIIKRHGAKMAMIFQTVFPGIRNLCQTVARTLTCFVSDLDSFYFTDNLIAIAVYVRGRLGIRIMQWTQLLTIGGGGAGYTFVVSPFLLPTKLIQSAFSQAECQRLGRLVGRASRTHSRIWDPSRHLIFWDWTRVHPRWNFRRHIQSRHPFPSHLRPPRRLYAPLHLLPSLRAANVFRSIYPHKLFRPFSPKRRWAFQLLESSRRLYPSKDRWTRR